MNQKNQIESGVNNEVVTSAVAYLTLVGWFISYLILNKPKSGLANFHIRQALGINLCGLALGMLFAIPLIGWAVGAIAYILMVIMWFIGFMSAIQRQTKPVPFLGDKFQEWFQGL